MGNSLVEVSDLWHVYQRDMVALRGVSLEIRSGDYVAIVGQNGSGKTTLAKHLNGLLRPSKGTVTVAGFKTDEVSLSKLSALVGYVFQNPDHMLFARTIEEEVAFGPRNLGLSQDAVSRRVKMALEATGLGNLRKESSFFFGKGMRRKVTLAAVLSMEPKILVIDEPTIGMDYKDCRETFRLISDLHERNHTIVIVTHDMRMVADYAARVVAMSKGQVVLDMPTREAMAHPKELAKASVRPPQISRVASELSDLGIPRDAISVDEVAESIVSVMEGKD